MLSRYSLSLRASQRTGSSAGTAHTPNLGVETFKLGQRGTFTLQNHNQSVNVARETHVRIEKEEESDDAGSYPVKYVGDNDTFR
jgi:hypothetical protein